MIERLRLLECSGELERVWYFYDCSARNSARGGVLRYVYEDSGVYARLHSD